MKKAEPAAAPSGSKRSKALGALLLPVADVHPCIDANYLVRGWLGRGGLSVLYGESNVGKTFVALDMAMHVASGQPWHGCKVKAGNVVYIAAEGGGGIRNRLAAIKIAQPKMVKDASFYLLPTNLDLFGEVDTTALCEILPTGQASLIVVDTMARSMGAGDENSAKDVAQFVANLDTIRRLSGAHVMVIHHSGKDTTKGARGSSALRAAVDTEIAVTKGKIECSKQRDMECSSPLFFALRGVELGKDIDDEPVTSAIVVPTEVPSKKHQKLNARAEIADEALTEALSLHGTRLSRSDHPPNQTVVEISKWKALCEECGLTDANANPDAKRKAFDRAKKSLLENGVIKISGKHVWRVSSDE